MGATFFVSNVVSTGTTGPVDPMLGERSEADEWLFSQRSYPTGTIPAGATERAWRASMEAVATDAPNTVPDQWTNIGPAPILGGQIEGPTANPRVTGRVVDIAVDPNQTGHWFVATAGGIWETANSGGSWIPKTDAVVSLGTTTVALAASNPQILFAGTHDINGRGVGLLKSTDGGANWAITGEFVNQTFFRFTEVEVDPEHADTVMAVTTEVYQPGGVFKSTNGGSTFGPPTLRGNGTALAINRANFSQQYAAIRNNFTGFSNQYNGVYRSTTGGDDWEYVSGPWDAAIMVEGGDVKIGMSPTSEPSDKETASFPGAVYVVVPGAGMWVSHDPWEKAPTWSQLPAVPNGFTNPDIVMVDPSNPDVFYAGAGGHDFYRYAPTQSPAWMPIYPSTHVDQHAMAAENSTVLLGNDGGFWISTNQGTTWTNKNTNLSTIQFYAGSLNSFNASQALGGSQDNGTEWWTGNLPWQFIYGGDGAYSAFSATDPDIWLVSAQGLEYIVKVTDGVQSWGRGSINFSGAAFIAPIKRAPHNNVVVAGSNNMWKSTNFFTPGADPEWYVNGPEETGPNGELVAISAIAFAPSDPCSLTYAYGTARGNLRITVTAGELSGGIGTQSIDTVGPWKNLDPLGQVPDRPVTAIAFHPTNAAIIYVALSSFDGATPGHIFKTSNGLDPYPTWENVTPNPPGKPRIDFPINALAIDPAHPNTIYAGADLGVWRSTNNGALDSWSFMGPASGMPNVPVFDLAFNPADGHLFAFTYGRGAFKLNANTVLPTERRLVNVSTRLAVGTGDNVLIGGFILSGSSCSTKQVVIRGLGPSTGVSGYLQDPYIELRRGDGSIVAINDNWADASNVNDIPVNLRPNNPLESAILASLEPGNYTVILKGVNDGTGIGLFEAYDLQPSSSAKLANVSTRGFVQTQDNVMIGGLILTGANSRIVMRGIGPSMKLDETLSDPFLELKDANGTTLATNDDWEQAPNANDIPANLRPTNSSESAILKTLVPGQYTVILRGANGETGIGLFEAYHLDI